MTTDTRIFEKRRLALFRDNGFQGESRWFDDGRSRRTYVIERGTSACPTVLVHGGLSEASEWCLLAGRLPGHVVVVDRPGSGLSYAVHNTTNEFRAAAAAWLADVLDQLGAEQVDLVGGSIGGYFTMAFAMAYPERVRRLALMGAPPGLGPEAPVFVRLMANPATARVLGLMKIRTAEQLRKRVFPSLVARPADLPVEFLEVALAADGLPGVSESNASLVRALFSLRGARRAVFIGDDMTSLRVPTLVLWGDDDKFVPKARGEQLVASMPEARLQLIADAGHVPYLDQPEVVASELVTFLREGTGTSSV